MIVTADLHLKEETADVVFREVFRGLEVAAANDMDQTLAILGDVFDVRNVVPVWLLNKFLDTLSRWVSMGFHVIMIPGNHDQYDAGGRNVLEVYEWGEPLAGQGRVSVYSHPTIDKWGLWVPYVDDKEHLEATLDEWVPNLESSPGVVFGHWGVVGAQRDPHHLDTDGIWLGDSRWPVMMILGHYHKHHGAMPGEGGVWDVQVKQAFSYAYLGSPYQTRASEAGQVKGYGVWDGRELRFEAMDWGPKYQKVALVAGQILDLASFETRDDVRVTAGPGVDPEAIGVQLKEAGFTRFTVTPEVEENQARLDVKADADLLDYAREYVRQYAGDLPQDELLDVFRQLWADQ